MIRLKPDELETVAGHIPEAEDACQRARTTLSWELSSLVMNLPGVSTPAIEELRDELVHWLKRYEDKLNEAEELLYRTAAAMRQADQTLADNMKELGLEFLGWYDVQRLFGEYDPVTGERLSAGDRLLAGGMLLLSVVPPAKGAGIAGKAAIKGAKALDTASTLSKVKHVVHGDKIKGFFQTIYHQVVKAPLTETARLFKKQWDEFVESIASVSWQPAYAGVGPASRVWMSGSKNEVKDATFHMIKRVEGEAIGKGIISSTTKRKVTTRLKATKLSSEKIQLDWLPDKYSVVEVKGTVKVAGKEVDVSRRVYQIEIDKNYVPKDPAAAGLTNKELMAKGKSPYVVKDGKESKVELHHLIQKEPGGMWCYVKKT
ncbi:pre-toxin TG domain-containing protein, partial [Geobacillus thermodenitrificans]|uniref:pre-toxin TG domain-containing protein n=1 Tax=Geobacillus thermodenitrificans TaxID=33940 RepID=UPI002E223575|nr:pre-toxin TG domain-containing protein [Geobacillus thermodenitrificans]